MTRGQLTTDNHEVRNPEQYRHALCGQPVYVTTRHGFHVFTVARVVDIGFGPVAVDASGVIAYPVADCRPITVTVDGTSAFASDMGLRPGQWPQQIPVVVNGKPDVLSRGTERLTQHDELAGFKYWGRPVPQ